MDGCSFDPAGNYACYKIPTAANAMCPEAAMPPQASTACTVRHVQPVQQHGRPAGRHLQGFERGHEDRLVRLRERQVELRQRHGLAVPGGAGCQSSNAGFAARFPMRARFARVNFAGE